MKMMLPKSKKVYTLPSYSLPSQYRTLLPVTDLEVQRLMGIERRSRRMKSIFLALTALIFLLIVVMIAVIVAIKVSMDEVEQPVLFSEWKEIVVKGLYETERRGVNVKGQGLLSYQSQQMKRGTLCTDQCLDFAAFKYKATCENGMCRCHGHDYDDVTCLPRFGDCHIEIQPLSQFLQASHLMSAQTVYACRVRKDQSLQEIATESTQKLVLNLETNQPKDVLLSSTLPSLPSTLPSLPSTLASLSSSLTSSLMSGQSPKLRKRFTTMADLDSSTINGATTSSPSSSNGNFFTTKTKGDMKINTDFVTKTRQTRQIHVISMYNNKETPFTRLVLTSSKAVNLTLVLASYDPVIWKVKTGKMVTLEQVIMVSNHEISRARVFISPLHPSNPDTRKKLSAPSSGSFTSREAFIQSGGTSITRMMLRTGYGNDRTSGNTPQLLKSVTERVGPIQAFAGVAHADLIQYNVDHFNT